MKVRIPKNEKNSERREIGEIIELYVENIMEDTQKRNKHSKIRKIDIYTNMLQMKYIEKIVSSIIECNCGKEISCYLRSPEREFQAREYLSNKIKNEMQQLIEKDIYGLTPYDSADKLDEMKEKDYIHETWKILIPNKTPKNKNEIEQIEEMLQKIYNKSIDDKLAEVEKYSTKRKEEKEFLGELEKYTRGYSFLANSLKVHFSEKGYSYGNTQDETLKISKITSKKLKNNKTSNSKKFSSVDNYLKFDKIQSKLKEKMFEGYSEEKAIKKLLSEKELTNVERKILEARRSVIEKSIER